MTLCAQTIGVMGGGCTLYGVLFYTQVVARTTRSTQNGGGELRSGLRPGLLLGCFFIFRGRTSSVGVMSQNSTTSGPTRGGVGRGRGGVHHTLLFVVLVCSNERVNGNFTILGSLGAHMGVPTACGGENMVNGCTTSGLRHNCGGPGSYHYFFMFNGLFVYLFFTRGHTNLKLYSFFSYGTTVHTGNNIFIRQLSTIYTGFVTTPNVCTTVRTSYLVVVRQLAAVFAVRGFLLLWGVV